MSRKSTLLLLAVTAFNLVYNAFLPLHPDEAYYWTWSRHLQLSYFDHPPLIAYLIRLACLVGQSEFVIRLVSVVCMTAASWTTYQLAKNLFSEKVADISLLVLLFMPVTQAGYLIVTPDSPLILFWSLTMYCLYLALWKEARGFFYWAGICSGLLLLSKYTGVLLLPAVFLFLLTTRFRKALLREHVYLSLLIALILFSPVIVWNSQHDWVSFRFQLMHAGDARALNLGNIGDFLGGQAYVANPIFMLAILYYAVRYIRPNLREEKLAFLFWPYMFTYLVFLYGALHKRSEANWTAPAYVTGVILLAYWLEKYNRRWIYYTGVALTVVLLVMFKFPEAFPGIPRQLVLKRQFMGYNEMFRQARIYTRDPKCLVLSDSYQHASEAWYYLGRSETYVLSTKRMSMYDFWPGELAQSPREHAVFFGGEQSIPALREHYRRVRQLGTLYYTDRFVTRKMKVYDCRN